jgi:hypothetical protein
MIKSSSVVNPNRNKAKTSGRTYVVLGMALRERIVRSVAVPRSFSNAGYEILEKWRDRKRGVLRIL